MTHGVRRRAPAENHQGAIDMTTETDTTPEETVDEHVPTTLQEARETLARVPERALMKGLDLVRSRARHDDLMGTAARGYLRVLHGGLGVAVRALSRLEKATQPPTRPRIGKRPQPAASRPARSKRAQPKTA
jgi:hypothetical protein